MEGVAGRPLVKWINMAEEYMKERGGRRGVNVANRMCISRKLETSVMVMP